MKSFLKILKCIASVSIVDNFIKKPTKKGNIFLTVHVLAPPPPKKTPPLKNYINWPCLHVYYCY